MLHEDMLLCYYVIITALFHNCILWYLSNITTDLYQLNGTAKFSNEHHFFLVGYINFTTTLIFLSTGFSRSLNTVKCKVRIFHFRQAMATVTVVESLEEKQSSSVCLKFLCMQSLNIWQFGLETWWTGLFWLWSAVLL